jgi:hypothetical protein
MPLTTGPNSDGSRVNVGRSLGRGQGISGLVVWLEIGGLGTDAGIGVGAARWAEHRTARNLGA